MNPKARALIGDELYDAFVQDGATECQWDKSRIAMLFARRIEADGWKGCVFLFLDEDEDMCGNELRVAVDLLNRAGERRRDGWRLSYAEARRRGRELYAEILARAVAKIRN